MNVLQQQLHGLLVRLGGAAVREHVDDEDLDGVPHLVERYLFARAGSIYGGTSEIQRDLVARTLLG